MCTGTEGSSGWTSSRGRSNTKSSSNEQQEVKIMHVISSIQSFVNVFVAILVKCSRKG
jgi:hypothetical protein